MAGYAPPTTHHRRIQTNGSHEVPHSAVLLTRVDLVGVGSGVGKGVRSRGRKHAYTATANTPTRAGTDTPRTS